MSQAASSRTGSRVLDDLADVIGEDAALRLAWAFRGLRLYVPKNPAINPRIAEAIGEDLAARLCDVFYRTTIYMPSREAERVVVHQMARNGHTKRAIAETLHIGERQVYRLLQSAPVADGAIDQSKDDRQLSMF